jgi:hypothetical protein
MQPGENEMITYATKQEAEADIQGRALAAYSRTHKMHDGSIRVVWFLACK